MFINRRDLLTRSGLGFGAVALGKLLEQSGLLSRNARALEPSAASPGVAPASPTDTSPLSAKAPHFAPKAQRVIHIFLNGGCSHVDTFDPKPLLEKYAGKPIPNNRPTERKTGAALPSPYKFQKYGQSGIEVSEIFAKVGSVIDEFTVLRSLHADVPNHEPSLLLMNCGEPRLVRPSMGSWLTYGLGTENENLPAFIAMCPGGYPIQETQNWQAGFLPGIYQGTYINTQHTDLEKLIEHIRTKHQSREDQRRQLDLVQELNGLHKTARPGDAQLDARIHSFELAYRMQAEAADAFDTSREPANILEAYGQSTQGRQLLIARRLIERGVRFVQVWHGEGQPWDNHDDIEVNHRRLAGEVDGGIAALITDLKSSGLLDSTLVMISGEFGRTPTVELPTPGQNAGKVNGRDHNHYGFTMLLAGGGVKKGYVYGATDEFGFAAVENKVHIHDLHATLLHLLGFDHEKFTYRYAGRDFRLTDVHGRVVRDLIA
ncbi:MAG: DUF1501 domain-containing protein [Pirellulales bacterium]|nr:DUF1501 domain-containing protein [Pirellulales bacterium]